MPLPIGLRHQRRNVGGEIRTLTNLLLKQGPLPLGYANKNYGGKGIRTLTDDGLGIAPLPIGLYRRENDRELARRDSNSHLMQ